MAVTTDRKTSAHPGSKNRIVSGVDPEKDLDRIGMARAISWRHCAIGILVGEAILLILSNGGLAISNALWGSVGANAMDGGIVGTASFFSVIIGGYLAARLAGRFGLFQGTIVGIGFIAFGAVFQFLQEAQIVHSALSSGSHSLVDLGSMNMGNLMAGDFIALVGGSIGGLLSRRR